MSDYKSQEAFLSVAKSYKCGQSTKVTTQLKNYHEMEIVWWKKWIKKQFSL